VYRSLPIDPGTIKTMVKRGSYAKGVATKEELLTAALEVVGRVGYGRSSVREIADGVGITHAGLMHHFGSKDVLFREVLRKRDELSRERSEQAGIGVGTPEHLTTTIRSNAEVPGLVQLYVRLSGEASEDGNAAHEFFAERFRELRKVATEQIRVFQAAGRLPEKLDAERIAVLILAAADGLQLQWLYDRELDMPGLIEYLLEAFGLVEDSEPGGI
jgi:AcrR family transcriptional regulator